MINWLKKKIVKSMIEDAFEKLPELKEYALLYWEKHKDELLAKVKEEIAKIIKEQIGH